MFYTYILYSAVLDKYYVGYTHDINSRLVKHNMGATFSTRHGRPWVIVYYEEYLSKTEAILREREIKQKKSRKYIEALIAKG